MSTPDFRDDQQFLVGVFAEVVRHAGAHLHQVKNHQIPTFTRLLAGFETLIENFGSAKKNQGLSFSVTAPVNQIGFSVIALSCRSAEGNELSNIEVAVAADRNIYLFNRSKDPSTDFFPAQAHAVVKGDQTISDVTNAIRTALVMLDPKYIGPFIAETCSTQLVAGVGHDLFKIRHDLI